MTSIFIQSLADYNAGRIVGRWVELEDLDKDGLWDAIKEILAMSQEPLAEEWEIADYDGFYGLSPSISQVLEIANLLSKHGEAYAIYAQYIGEDYAAEEGFEESYCGEWESFRDYADDLFDQLYLYELPDHLHFYIDYEAFARDLSMDYHHDQGSDGKIHIFRCC
ncbi:antirestriction protein [Xenococcus sp. PCC 7305]|uniref:antirestriction protein ArdA n=1 Tax=Xenococcus sp. PCC 7305 TaxID=102125 RepID=UPI0002AD11BE|nr:antirestriction protein ArdA [Xenococcus sp. PCC 7305]ELS02724.1 antirestriction protein [Xenococcus sp. PCC 7305]